MYANVIVWLRSMYPNWGRYKIIGLCIKQISVKLFKTYIMQIIMACQENYGFRLPNELIASRTKKLESSHFLLEYKL